MSCPRNADDWMFLRVMDLIPNSKIKLSVKLTVYITCQMMSTFHHFFVSPFLMFPPSRSHTNTNKTNRCHCCCKAYLYFPSNPLLFTSFPPYIWMISTFNDIYDIVSTQYKLFCMFNAFIESKHYAIRSSMQYTYNASNQSILISNVLEKQ
eukprot:192168_1